MTVFLWGAATDAVIAAVAAALQTRGCDALVADGTDCVSIDITGDLVLSDGRSWRMADLTGVLVRPADTAELDNYAALAAWTEVAPITVLNRLSAGASNRSKPYQLRLMKEAGLAIPETLVTTDPDDVRAFVAEHGQVIYKSTSGVRSIVDLLDPTDDSRLEHVRTCPTLFQRYVTGTDHRVHVVGPSVFATRIESTAIDYRYAGTSGAVAHMTSVTLPPAVAARCLAVSKSLGLGLAGIDLRLDAEGRWWGFEVNTSPGFIWFEQQTGQPIAAAVADLLRAELS